MPIPKPPQAVVKQANPDHKTRPLQTNGPNRPNVLFLVRVFAYTDTCCTEQDNPKQKDYYV